MTQIKYVAAVAVLALAVFPTQIFGQPVVCVPPPPDLCGGKSDCVVIDDEWQVTVEPSGQIYLGGRRVSRRELEEDATAWAETGTWPTVVRGHTGTKYAQITSIVEMLRKTGVWTKISCVAPRP
jgi:hypothetical protein